MIEIEVNQQQLDDVRRRLDYIKNGANRALSRALNKTASKAKTEASKAIRQQVRLTASYVRERLQGPANGFAYKATINKLQAKIAAPTRGLRLDHFLSGSAPGRSGRPLIKVRVKPKGASIAMPSAFFVGARNSGGQLIAMRNDALRAAGSKTKLAPGEYTVLSGPSLSQVFTTVKDDIGPDMNAYLATVFERETQYLLDTNTPSGDGVSD